jgi:hypothetical protein
MKNFCKLFTISLAIFSTGCSDFIKKVDQNSIVKAPISRNVSLVFSHNISGETHPCGCRNFPLGGMPQVAGLFHSLQGEGELLYVDTGDTFFPSSKIPTTMTESLSYAANHLADGLDLLGLKYFVPGDQDFALGLNFLVNIAKNHKFKFLLSNLKDESSIPHERFAKLTYGTSTLFLVGLVDPDIFNGNERDLFVQPESALPIILKELQAAGYDSKNDYHRLIVLSHAGIDPDEILAQKFPMMDWIIGAHSQSFLRLSKDIGNVKIVQTLSKNHYVGDIKIDVNSKKETDNYVLHETRDELEQKLSPNPLRAFIDEHKKKMNDLQIKEQDQMIAVTPLHKDKVKFQTVQSCIGCHKVQGEFWQGTAHSIAYATLMNVHEQNNLQCIKCHSLGLGDPKGFTAAKNMVNFKEGTIIDYWNQAHELSSKIKSVRSLPSSEVKNISKKWMALDAKLGVKHNFANVQCLNCHTQDNGHPFNADAPQTKEERLAAIKTKCIACHSSDQSPEWHQYKNEKVFLTKLKKVSCPLSQ